MKKKSGSRIVKIFKNVLNIRYWLDLDRIKQFTLYLFNGFKNMFIPQKKTSGESFEEATKALHLNEAELESRKKGLYRLTLLMLLFAFILISYSFYHLYYGAYRAMILSFVVFLIAMALAFRYHFWYFQIKQHKLGCTLREWYKQGLLGDKNE